MSKLFTRSVCVLQVLWAATAFGQDALKSFQEPDRVVVTGSLIPSAEEVTATPVDTLGRRDIELSGSTEVLQILQKREADIVGAGNLGSTNANVALGATQGGASVSIRGLPTLVLYEGRRIADSAAISTGGLQFGDVSVFPSSLISRIEVLKDGASALYGSDAVGGVINIFLKHDYKGVEVGYRYGFTTTSGTQDTQVWLVAGTGNDKTNITLGYQYYQTSGLFMRERAYSQPAFGTSFYAGQVQQPPPLSTARGTTLYYGLNASLNSPFDVPGVTPGSQTAINAIPGAYTQLPGRNFVVRQFDLSTVPTSTQLQNNQNFIFSFTHQLYGKKLELFGDVLYANNHNEVFLNAQPLNNMSGTIVIPPGHVSTGPGDPTIYNPFNFAIDGGNPALGVNPRLVVSNRYTMFPRTFTNDTTFYYLLGGLRGQIGKNYTFETAYYYSNYAITFRNANLIIASQLNAMIAGTARDFAGNIIPPLDFFAVNPIGTGAGQVSRDQFSTIFGTNIRYQDSSQGNFDAKFTGFPVNLPGGPLGFAIGAEYRREAYKVTDSPEIYVLSVPIQEVSLSRGIYAIFLEMTFPLVSPQMKIPGIYSMDLTMAGRHEHYEGVSPTANVPKVTFRYQPIQDLTLRASFADSFVAPNLYQLYGPSSTGFSGLTTLPNGSGQPAPNDKFIGQYNLLTGSNPALAASTAQSWGFGAVYSPRWLQGLTISVDYFNVLQQNPVTGFDGDTIARSVNSLGPASPYYGFVHTGGFNGPLIPPNGGPLGNGTFYIANNFGDTYVVTKYINLGAIRTTGWDFSVSYTRDLKQFGILRVGANAVLFVNADFKPFANQTSFINGKAFAGTEGIGTTPQYKINALIDYTYQHWSLGFGFNYIPGVYNFLVPYASGAFQPVAAFSQFDGRVSYAFVPPGAKPAPKSIVDPKGGPVRSSVVAGHWYDGLTLAVGCNNIFNHQPPYANGFNSNTDLSTYDPYGRLVYFQVSKKF